MKFTFLILTLNRGGAQRMLVEITNGLVRRGHDVTILMPSYGYSEFDGVLAHVIKAPSHEIKPEDVPLSDIIVSNFYLTIPTAQEASRQGRGMHVRLSLCYEPAFLEETHTTFTSYHATDKIVVLSEWQQDLIQLLHGIRGEIVPVGVSNEFVNRGIRGQSGALTISAILRRPEGGLCFHRDQEFLVQQLSRVKELHPEVRIHFISPPGEFEESYFLNSIYVDERFRLFTPLRDEDLAYLYNISDIFVTSSIYETANLVALEAMRCGAAVVSTYSGANRDSLTHEVNGLISYRYEEKMAENVVRLIRDEELRRRLAAAGEREAALWTWERSTERFEAAMHVFLRKGNRNRR